MTDQIMIQRMLKFMDGADLTLRKISMDSCDKEESLRNGKQNEISRLINKKSSESALSNNSCNLKVNEINGKISELNEKMNNIRQYEARLKNPVAPRQPSGTLDELNTVFSNSYVQLMELMNKGGLTRSIKMKQIIELFTIVETNGPEIIRLYDVQIEERKHQLENELNHINEEYETAVEQVNKKYDQMNGEYSSSLADTQNDMIQAMQDYLCELFPQDYLNELMLMLKFRTLNVISGEISNMVPYGYVSIYPKEYTDYSAVSDLFLRHVNKIVYGQEIRVPQAIDLKATSGIWVLSDRSYKKSNRILNQLSLSVLSSVPVGYVDMYFIDPLNKGRSIASLLSFREYENGPIKDVATDEESINTMISNLNVYVQDVIQDKFRGIVDSIWEYNDGSQMDKLSMKVLNIYDFPASFSQRAIDGLYDLIYHSSGLGILINIICNKEVAAGARVTFNINSLMSAFQKVYVVSDEIAVNKSGFEIVPFEMPTSAQIIAFAQNYQMSSETQSDAFGVASVREISNGLFSMNALDRLDIPVGRDINGRECCITFGVGLSHHMLITGATGSGKSTFLHTLILESMYNYPPEMVNLYLMDFKSGIEFKVYDRTDLPHIKLLAIDAMQEFGESILANMCDEIKRRGDLFKDAGVDSISKYKLATGKILPRILIVIDEFQTLFDEHNNRSIAIRCADYADEIVMKGRSFGIHLVLSTQSMKVLTESISIRRTTIDQMRVRMGLRCSADDSKTLFVSRGEEAYGLMGGPIGSAVYQKDDSSELKQLRVAYADEDEKKCLLDEIGARCSGYISDIRVFEGRREYELPDDFITFSDEGLILEVGVPIAIAPLINLIFRNNYSSNLLIAGNNERMLTNMEGIVSKGLLAVPNRTVYHFKPLHSSVPAIESSRVCMTEKEIVTAVVEIYNVMQTRKKEENFDPIFIFVSNVQLLSIMQTMLYGDRVMLSTYADNPDAAYDRNDNVSEKLRSIIHSGGVYDIYFILTMSNCMQILPNIRSELSQFNNIIGFNLNDKESETIFGYGNSTVSNMALYWDHNADPILFKPYMCRGKS